MIESTYHAESSLTAPPRGRLETRICKADMSSSNGAITSLLSAQLYAQDNNSTSTAQRSLPLPASSFDNSVAGDGRLDFFSGCKKLDCVTWIQRGPWAGQLGVFLCPGRSNMWNSLAAPPPPPPSSHLTGFSILGLQFYSLFLVLVLQ